MRCLRKFEWVKLFRDKLPDGKGILGFWAKLAVKVAYRKGVALYCNYKNEVECGTWVGGIVGVKSILGVKSRRQAIEILDKLTELGYIEYEIDKETKKLTYRVLDLVLLCDGEDCGAVYAVNGYGFLCVPRTLNERLVEKGYVFEEADAWMDLWCHTVSEDPSNAFSFFSASVQYRFDAVLTLEYLGKRWGWEKTKVWRFFQKHKDVFRLERVPGPKGCLIFNLWYPCETEEERPDADRNLSKKSVALFTPIIRAYISLCWCCKYCYYDCISNISNKPVITGKIRGP